MAVPIGLTTGPRHHDPDSVMSQYLGCAPDQPHLYHSWPRYWRPQDWELWWYDPIPSTRYGSGRSIRGRHWFSMWEAPLPVMFAGQLVCYDEIQPDPSPESERIDYWKSITKEETAEERAQKEKLARKKERRQERKARDLECKAQQRRARNQFRKGAPPVFARPPVRAPTRREMRLTSQDGPKERS